MPPRAKRKRQEIRVRSWVDLQTRLFRGGLDSHLGKMRCPYVFRGLENQEYELTTSLSRLGPDYAGIEGPLLRAFQKYAHRNAVERESVWHWLSLAQHHGLPTRLLDWTYSPFVAMHFATSEPETMDQDGAIWAVRFEEVHSRLPPGLQGRLRAERAHVFNVEMLSEEVRSLDELQGFGESEFVFFFEPPSMDDRIVNQFALFSVTSKASLGLAGWLQARPETYLKLIIPSELKWEIRDKLDLANITERVLFPGLDGLSTWLRRYYGPWGRPGVEADRKEESERNRIPENRTRAQQGRKKKKAK